MKKNKIWIVTEMFFPDETSTAYIMTSIAENLSLYTEVHVICGPVGYDEIATKHKELKNITIHRIQAFNFNKNNIVQRFFRIVMLSIGMLLHGLVKIGSQDKVLLVTNPAFAIPLFGLLKTIKGFHFSILVHDIFPENLIPAGIIRSKKNIIYKTLTSLFNWSYERATQLIVLGRDMQDIMKKKTKNKIEISIIENWANLDNIDAGVFKTNQLVKQKGLEEKIVFLFAGNLGRLQGLHFLLDIIKEVKNDALHFAFIGSGALLPVLKKRCKDENFDNLSFWGTFSRNDQNLFLNASHFGIVTLDSEMYGLGVPSKTYNILAAGKPIFFIGNKRSEIFQMIVENNCGFAFEQGEKQKIIDFMNTINNENMHVYSELGRQARFIAENRYAKDLIIEKFRNSLQIC